MMGLVKWELRAAGEGEKRLVEGRSGAASLSRKLSAVFRLVDWS